VHPMMNNQTISLTERFVTKVARVWLLSRVRPLMYFQAVISTAEEFVTYVTGVWLLPCVRTPMLNQSRSMSERFVTHATRVMLHSSVNWKVNHKFVFIGERLIAYHVTWVRILFLVTLPVYRQINIFKKLLSNVATIL